MAQAFKEIQNDPYKMMKQSQNSFSNALDEKPTDLVGQVEREVWFSHFSPRQFTQLSTEPIYCTKFSNDGSLLATSFQDGTIQIISSQFNNTMYQFDSDILAVKEKRTKFPVTGLAWKSTYNLDGLDNQTLIGSLCDGSIMKWTPAMGNRSKKIALNPTNQYQTIDYSGDGKRFAVAGTLPQIEIYDDETLKSIQTIGGDGRYPAHMNKIFAVKFNPIYPNILYSGSWDQTIKFWDIRMNTKTQQINQIQTCGESIDLDSDLRTFATGGGTAAEGLKIWDIRDLTKPTVKINWSETAMGDPINMCFNTVKFVPGMSMVMGGVTDDVPAKCFNYKTGGSVI